MKFFPQTPHALLAWAPAVLLASTLEGASAQQPATPALDLARVPIGLIDCDGEECERGNRGTWIFHGAGGEAHWPSGAAAKLFLDRFDEGGVFIHRTDTPNSSSAGLTAVYRGFIHDGTVQGTVEAKWPGHFPKSSTPGIMHYTWNATVPQTRCDPASRPGAQEALETGQSAVRFRQLTSGFQCFLMSAKQGDGEAKSLVGLMYRDGIGTAVNYTEAFRWLEAGAIQGEYNAQLALEQMYETGIGIPQDAKLAAIWKEQATNNPLMVAQRRQGHEQQTEPLNFAGFAAALEAGAKPDVFIY